MAELPAHFLRNSISNYANTGSMALVTVVLTPLLARGLGAEQYGIWAFAGSLALYLELFEFGFGAATVKYVAGFAATGDTTGIRRTIATSFYALCIPGALSLLVGALVALAFPSIFPGLSPEVAHAAQVTILLVSFDLALSIPGDTFGGTLMGLQRYDIVNITLIVTRIAQAIAWAIVMATGGGLVALSIVTVVLSLLGQISRLVMVRRILGTTGLNPRWFDREQMRPFARLSVWLALTEASILAVTRLDTIIVGLVAGLPAAGIYAVAQKIPVAVNALIGPMTMLFYPHSADLAARQEMGRLRGAFLTGNRLSLAVAMPLCVTFGILAEPLLRTWVGPEFSSGSTVVVLLLAAMAVWALTRTGLLILQGMGEARVPALIHVGEALLNVALSVALGLAWGVNGVALATLIAAAVTNLGLLVPFLCRRFGLPIGRWAGDVARAHGPALVAAGAVGALASQWDTHRLVPLLLACAAITSAYLAAFITTGLTREELRGLRGFLRRSRAA
jgi:O-antigen/teichoic acid export membrane protein